MVTTTEVVIKCLVFLFSEDIIVVPDLLQLALKRVQDRYCRIAEEIVLLFWPSTERTILRAFTCFLKQLVVTATSSSDWFTNKWLIERFHSRGQHLCK